MKVSRKWVKLAGILVLAGAVAGGAFIWYCKKKKIEPSDIHGIIEAQNEEIDGNLRLYFLDVEGSAALAKLNGKYMLIDGGGSASTKFLMDYLEEMGVTELDYLLITSYDEGHLSGLLEVMREYPVSHILAPDYEDNTPVYKEYQSLVAEKEIEVRYPILGETYTFGNTFLNIVGPVSYDHENNGDKSLCIRLHYGDTNFLFGGDTGTEGEAQIEDWALANPELDLESEVYVVNRHGAAESSTDAFLNIVRPEYAVLSCGAAGTEYAPDQETLSRLEERGIKLFRTDRQGTVEAVSDGSAVTWDIKPSGDYREQPVS